jgi:hypothetical protein
VVAVGRDQEVFAGDLVAGVLPERVAEGRRLPDRQGRDGLLVRRRRADEDVLAAAAREEVDVGLDLVGREGDEVDHDVEVPVADGTADRRRVGHVPGQHLDAGGHGPRRGRAAVEDGEVVTQLDGSDGGRRADDPGTADEQDCQR